MLKITKFKISSNRLQNFSGFLALTGLIFTSNAALAAEGFRVRFPLAGTLGGEMLAPITPGIFGSLVATQISVNKLTDNAGAPYRTALSALPPATVDVGIDLQQSIYNLILGYTTTEKYADGHLSLIVNLPYSTIDRSITATSSLPGFFQNLANTLAQQTSGQVKGLGDLEVTAAWSQKTERLKLVLGMSLSSPTGDHGNASGINVGYGNFYTLRTGAAIACQATEKLTIGSRLSLGFNTKNRDNNWQSGDFYALDVAAGYTTPFGVLGTQFVRVEQYTNDLGAKTIVNAPITDGNRFVSNGAGLFFTAPISPIGAALNLSYMKTLESRNAMSGSYIQARLSKMF